MAEPLKNQLGVEIVNNIAMMISRVFPEFERATFVEDALDGYEALDLIPRGWKIARTLRGYLPVNLSFAKTRFIRVFNNYEVKPRGDRKRLRCYRANRISADRSE